MVSLLPTKFHEILFSSFRGVALTNCDGQDKNNMSPHKSGGRHNDICVSQRIEHLGENVPNSSSKIDYRKESIKPLLVHRCITHLWIYTSMVGQTRMANENRTSELLWYCCNI